ncbi:MAG: 2-oxoacid:acceptor oxidoreductase subunit alpha [Elusimicrobia bacterium]|nr:2-oxoacid:acceptor oxidoreductase subunit alpha [Elusimicrobiota bacterium]
MNSKIVDIWIAGAAGDGVQSTSEMLAKIAARCGLHVYIYNSYQSAIRGGYVYAQIRISAKKIRTPSDRWDILVALNTDSIERHKGWVKKEGVLIFNCDRAKAPGGLTGIGIPISEVVSNPLMQNTVFLGAACALTGLPLEKFEKAILEVFGKKSQEVKDANLKAAKEGAGRAKSLAGRFKLPVSDKSHILITGNQALAFGAAEGGVRFYSAYPMTPASGVLHWMADHAAKLGICVMQAEDEISVINMAIGASFAGARSMVATSGGGFALMTEAVGLAAMTETPLVAINVCRAGPSTGVPTKTEQGDLWQVLGAGQGDYPKAVIAPLDVEDCFYMVQHSLNLADRYQIPVLMISDLLLSEHNETLEALDPKRIKIDRGEWAGTNGAGQFLRYLYTPGGVSPRAKPGMPDQYIFTAASDDHRESGTLISDVDTDPVERKKMMEKRMRKMEGILKEMPPNVLIGEPKADLTLVGWGSGCGILTELVARAKEEGKKVNALAIRSVWPFLSKEVAGVLTKAKGVMMIENNFTGQMAKLIRQETGFEIPHLCLKYDGEPFYLESTWPMVQKALKGKAQAREVILTPYGLAEDKG